jgi:hypothetical protein
MKTKLTKAALALIAGMNKAKSYEGYIRVARQHQAKELGKGACRVTFQVGDLAVKVLYSKRTFGDQNKKEANSWKVLSKVKGMENFFAPVVAHRGKCLVMPVVKEFRGGNGRERLEKAIWRLSEQYESTGSVRVASVLCRAACDLHGGNCGVMKVGGKDKLVCIDYGF